MRHQRWTFLVAILTALLAVSVDYLVNVGAATAPLFVKQYLVPLLLGLVVLAAVLRVGSQRRQKTSLSAESKPPHSWRQRFLKVLINRYSPPLDDWLPGAAQLILRLQALPIAVDPPTAVLRDGRVLPDSLPDGATIIQHFDAAEGHLLILGEPGAGKSTLLQELALVLAQHALHDHDTPMPVIFHLSSWSVRRPPLEEWLIAELVGPGYGLSLELAGAWLRQEEILPLLDGLDEVESTHRTACVAAINGFQRAHSLLPMVVCSRSAEYQAQQSRLTLRSAVVIQPLSDVQVGTFFAEAGRQVASIWQIFHADRAMQELLTTPLWLRVMTLAYEDFPPDKIPWVQGNPARWRQQLFRDYVERQLRTRNGDGARTPAPVASRAQTLHWLCWLARQMRTRGLTDFYLEYLQPSWLPTVAAHHDYRVRVGLYYGAYFGLLGTLLVGLTNGLTLGLLSGLLIGLLAGLLIGRGIGPRFALYLGLVSVRDIQRGAIRWQGIGARIRPVEALEWSWRVSLLVGLFYGLFGGLLIGLLVGLFEGLSNGVFYGVQLGLLLGLYGALNAGLNPAPLIERNRLRPNQGIERSLRYAIVVCVGTLGGGLLIGLLSIPLATLFGVSHFHAITIEVLVAVLVGVNVVPRFGADAVIRTSALRTELCRAGVTPRRYADFLDHAVERVLLQKVGGGYSFVHPLVREYLASLADDELSQR